MVAGPRAGKKGTNEMKPSPKAKTIAYIPLTEKQKHDAMENLIKKLNDPKDPTGNYRSPGAPKFNVNTMKQT